MWSEIRLKHTYLFHPHPFTSKVQNSARFVFSTLENMYFDISQARMMKSSIIPSVPLPPIGNFLKSKFWYRTVCDYTFQQLSFHESCFKHQFGSKFALYICTSPSSTPLKSKVRNSAGFVVCVLENIYFDISQAPIVKFFGPTPTPPPLLRDFSEFQFDSKI